MCEPPCNNLHTLLIQFLDGKRWTNIVTKPLMIIYTYFPWKFQMDNARKDALLSRWIVSWVQRQPCYLEYIIQELHVHEPHIGYIEKFLGSSINDAFLVIVVDILDDVGKKVPIFYYSK